MMTQMLQVMAQAHAGGGISLAMGAFLIVGILTSVFWIWTMVDCLSSSMPTGEKVMWFFIILFLHFVGALIYFLVARRPHNRRIVT